MVQTVGSSCFQTIEAISQGFPSTANEQKEQKEIGSLANSVHVCQHALVAEDGEDISARTRKYFGPSNS